MSGLVAVTPYGNEAASTRVRVFDWLYRLAPDTPIHAYAGTRNNSPLTLLAHPLAVIGAGRDLRALASSSIDRLLLHRAASPFGSGDLEARLLGAARWRVYDFDDALQWDPGRSVTSLLGSNATKCIRCIKAADRVVAGNDVLAEWAGQFARNVTVVPVSYTHLDVYKRQVLVKTSYFPNWQASGADGPYRATPNLMVVVPTAHTVTLTYGTATAGKIGFVASGAGVVLLAGGYLVARRRRSRQPPTPIETELD